MEHNSSFDSFELHLTAQAQDFLRTAAKWAMFLAILGFIVIAFWIFAALGMLAAGSVVGDMPSSPGMGAMAFFSPTVLGLAYLIMAILYFFPVLYLYKFSSKIKNALSSNSSDELTEAFGNLKSHYKFIGIITIITIIASIVAIVAAITMVAGAASGM